MKTFTISISLNYGLSRLERDATSMATCIANVLEKELTSPEKVDTVIIEGHNTESICEYC